MKASDIIIQLHSELPKHTELFSTNIALSSLTFSGGVVTATTSSAHGLSTNDTVVIQDALSPNPLPSLTSSEGIATATTLGNHDLTENFPDGPDSTVNITGAVDYI